MNIFISRILKEDLKKKSLIENLIKQIQPKR